MDDRDRVLAGHGRLLAARKLGFTDIPTVRLTALSEAQLRAYVIADNRLAENAGWDQDLLALELAYITELDLEFDLTITGFETPELDILLGVPSEAPDPTGAVDVGIGA